MNPKFNMEAFSKLKRNVDVNKLHAGRPRKVKKKKKSNYDDEYLKKESFITGITSSDKIVKLLFDAILGAMIMFILSTDLVTKTLGMFITDFYRQTADNIIIPAHIQYYYRNMHTEKRQISMKGKLIVMGLFVVLYVIIKNWFIVDY
jgi:hypothetical protein